MTFVCRRGLRFLSSKTLACCFNLILLLGIGSVRGQPALDSVIATLGQKAVAQPPELLYIQTSKDIYEPGEDLWFKLYQLNARTFFLSDQSKSLYLQIVREHDHVAVWQEMYPVAHGVAHGHVYLDKNLLEGSYILEAYTSKSFYSGSSPFFASRKIQIVGDIYKALHVPTQETADTLFRFDVYPESGNLIQGISNRLAFKATNGRGKPEEVGGVLLEDGQPLVRFGSVHEGMGVMSFTPAAGKRYHMALDNGREYELPKIYGHGITMQKRALNAQYLEFTIKQSPGRPPADVYLMAQVRGISYCGAKVTVKDSMIVKLPMREFTTAGIAEITLFDHALVPIAERLVFLNPQKRLFINVGTDKKEYAIRGPGRLNITVTDPNGSPVIAHLGVSIFDKAYADKSYPISIESYIMLASQIKGNIHDPGYYFDERNGDRLEAMDLLLMTQGWRRYLWTYDMPDEMGKQFLYDEIQGVQSVRNSKKIGGANQLIQVSNSDAKSFFVWTDTTGRFAIEPETLNLLRGGYVYLTPMIGREHGPRITLDAPFVNLEKERGRKQPYYPFVDRGLLKQIPARRPSQVSLSGVLVLDELTVSAKRRKPFRDKFMGSLDSLTKMKINGPWVCRHGYLENYRTGYSHLMGDKNSPVQCVDMEKDSANSRREPVEGETYDLVKYEPNGPNGVYVLTDVIRRVVYKITELKEDDLLKINNISRTKAYYNKREFYMPDHHERQDPSPDVRNTLLWNPSVITNKEGRATLEFSCSDINDRFMARIEGTDGAGLFGAASIEFEVVRPSKKAE